MINNNLPKKYEDSFFYKIKLFCINLFKNKKNEEKNVFEEEIVENKTNDLKESLNQKVAENSQKQEIDKLGMREIADKYASNPELLSSLSLEKLNKINNYYLDLIEQLTEKIKEAS